MSTEIITPQLWSDLAVIGGTTIGAFTRTMIPFWAKLRETPEVIFEKKFLGTAILSFLGAVGVGLGLFSTLKAATPEIASMSLAGIFAVMFLAGLGANHALNWGIDQVSPTTPTTPTTTAAK